ncbi:hypothetical protein JCM3766R1_001440 [Sporobolomyces carnicolor]
MDGSPDILAPHQLPTPADSPIVFRTDSDSFRLSQSPRPPTTTASLPRSSSAPLQTRAFRGYSAHEAAADRDFSTVLRSELLGPSFASEITPPSSMRRPLASSRHGKPRQSPRSPYPPSPRSSPPVLSFSSSDAANAQQASLSATRESPLSSAYRLSPFNPTTEASLASPLALPRKICLTPCRVLDAPNLSDNFYETTLDWSRSNHLLAVALGPQVFTWKNDGTVRRIAHFDPLWTRSRQVTSICWIGQSDTIAIGEDQGSVSIYDARTSQLARQLAPHAGRVGVSASFEQLLSTGSADRAIFQRDLRIKNDVVRVIKSHKAEVTALEWNDGELASGGNDNSVRIFKGFESKPFLKLRKAHSAAIKALAWSPHQSSLLVTGGGTEDQALRFWNTRTGTLLREVATGSQVCQVVWSRTTNELVSSHGYASQPEDDNCVHVWRYKGNAVSDVPPYNPIATLAGGRGRMLQLALSHDGRYIACGSSDEVLRFWDIFPAESGAPDLARAKGQGPILDVFAGIR